MWWCSALPASQDGWWRDPAGHAPGGVRIGLAGRSARRLADVRAGLGEAASAWPLLAADSADPVSVAALARAARVVVSTVGPYRSQGLALVEACAAAGTDYADLSGEVLFTGTASTAATALRPTRARGSCTAAGSTGSVHLGTLLLHHAARADDAGDLQDTTLVVTALKGGLSGGTLASMLGQQDEMRASAQRRRVVADPYALSPDRAAEPDLGGERDLDWVRYDGELRMWVGPFVMAGFNTRVVRRSNALQDWAYGRRFRYREVTGLGASPAAPECQPCLSGFQRGADRGGQYGRGRAGAEPGDLPVPEPAPVGPVLQGVAAAHHAGVEPRHDERAHPHPQLTVVADPVQVPLAAQIRFGRAVRAERIGIGDHPAVLGTGAHLILLRQHRRQRPATETTLQRRHDQRRVLQVTGVIGTGGVMQQVPRSDGTESNPQLCTIRAPASAAMPWQRSMLSRMNSTSPDRSA